jgi:hypothetical protein
MKRGRSGVLLTIVMISAPAYAEPAARLVYLRGKDTETCPAETDVRVAVQTRLGYDPFSSYAASTMFVEVSREGPGFAANLKLVDGDNAVKGERTLHARGQCAELMDAMALTISIAIDPMSVTRNGPPPDAPPREKEVEMPPPSAITPETAAPETGERSNPTPERAPLPELSAAIGPLASLGAAPSLAAGATIGVDARLGHFVAGLEGRGDLPASTEAGGLGRVKSSLLAGSLFAGAREGPVFVCAVGSVGRYAVSSSDVAATNDRSALLLDVGLRVGAALRLTDRVEARIRAEMLANLQRHTLTISGQTAYEYPIASGDLGAALAVRFK